MLLSGATATQEEKERLHHLKQQIEDMATTTGGVDSNFKESAQQKLIQTEKELEASKEKEAEPLRRVIQKSMSEIDSIEKKYDAMLDSVRVDTDKQIMGNQKECFECLLQQMELHPSTAVNDNEAENGRNDGDEDAHGNDGDTLTGRVENREDVQLGEDGSFPVEDQSGHNESVGQLGDFDVAVASISQQPVSPLTQQHSPFTSIHVIRQVAFCENPKCLIRKQYYHGVVKELEAIYKALWEEGMKIKTHPYHEGRLMSDWKTSVWKYLETCGWSKSNAILQKMKGAEKFHELKKRIFLLLFNLEYPRDWFYTKGAMRMQEEDFDSWEDHVERIPLWGDLRADRVFRKFQQTFRVLTKIPGAFQALRIRRQAAKMIHRTFRAWRQARAT